MSSAALCIVERAESQEHMVTTRQLQLAPACTQVKFKSPWPPRTASEHNKLPFPLPLAFRPSPCMSMSVSVSMSSMSMSMHEASLTSHTATVHALSASPYRCCCYSACNSVVCMRDDDDDGEGPPGSSSSSSRRSGVFRGRRAGKGR